MIFPFVRLPIILRGFSPRLPTVIPMRWSLAASTVFLLAAVGARADIFNLHDGGQVRGELVNKDQEPRTTYHVKTATGGQVLLTVDQVKSVEPQTELQQEYDRVRWQYEDTIDDQWKLAEWCRENKLFKERKQHLEQVVALDPNHEEARHGLGYSQVGGKWVTEREHMEAQGYVRYGGRWRLLQEVELMERDRKNELAQKDWINKLKRWRGWLDDDKGAQARENILSIDDPYAVKALSMGLADERVREVKLMYVEALANIGTPNAMDVIVNASIGNADEEVRIVCLDKIVKADYKPAAATYVQKLKSPDNLIVNRAGVALGAMRDPATVGPLIDALVTTHKFKITPANPGQMSSTFGTGGPGGGSPGGFSFGQAKEKIIKKNLTNPTVLSALVGITEMNFNFDVVAWKSWFAAQKKPATLDARRD